MDCILFAAAVAVTCKVHVLSQGVPFTHPPTQHPVCFVCSCAAVDDYTSSKLLGSFLMMSQLQHTQPTSAMWLTGAAPNSLAIGLARQQGVQLPASASTA